MKKNHRLFAVVLVWILPFLSSHCGAEAAPPDSAPVETAAAGAPGGAGVRAAWPRHTLRAEQTWQLNPPNGERFDASALLLTKAGEVLTINDRGPQIYRVEFLQNTNAANLVPWNDCFSAEQVRAWAGSSTIRLDCEGLAQDEDGRVYICEETRRWILRCSKTEGIQRLDIDWTPVKKYFNPTDPNASFEGIAVGGGRLYVANERQMGRIIEVDLQTLKLTGNFAVRASFSSARDVHYSDLSWHDGVLYVVLRESRCVMAIDPADQRVLAEYNFREMERAPDVLYRSIYPTGQIEGLAVERDLIWLVTDNNGSPRARAQRDTRPTLFKARRAPLVR